MMHFYRSCGIVFACRDVKFLVELIYNLHIKDYDGYFSLPPIKHVRLSCLNTIDYMTKIRIYQKRSTLLK